MEAASSASQSTRSYLEFSAMMTFSTGIFLTFARLFEPFFRYTILVKFYQYYGDFYVNPAGLTEEEE